MHELVDQISENDFHLPLFPLVMAVVMHHETKSFTCGSAQDPIISISEFHFVSGQITVAILVIPVLKTNSNRQPAILVPEQDFLVLCILGVFAMLYQELQTFHNFLGSWKNWTIIAQFLEIVEKFCANTCCGIPKLTHKFYSKYPKHRNFADIGCTLCSFLASSCQSTGHQCEQPSCPRARLPCAFGQILLHHCQFHGQERDEVLCNILLLLDILNELAVAKQRRF